ncbi:MAG: ABC transporter ATP-binding protein [Candidatus Omnitrophica bacterium]|nr:ABC transporter ATP-binding protein [Candidatus Omnitrophota bacterium]
MKNLLEVKNLNVEFLLEGKIIRAVKGIDLSIGYNQTRVLAGESGSGKTVMSLAVTRIIPKNGIITSGEAYLEGVDLLKLDEKQLVKIRGRDIAYIFQEPASYLNPVFTIGNQVLEAITLHQNKHGKAAEEEALRLLSLVKIKEPDRVFHSYPHQLSGGMNQRAFIAMSLACAPKLLIADEPTTSLDVTIEAEILKLLADLKSKLGFSLLFITHNLSIAKKIADRVSVMYDGKIVEEADTKRIFEHPEHFHTKELIKAYEKIGKI